MLHPRYDSGAVQINVLFFAVFRERLGRDSQELELPQGATAADAIAALASEHEAVASLQGRFRVAVNREMVADDHPLGAGDELALIPPVAGGSGQPPRHVRLCEEPLSLDRVCRAVSDPGVGGIATFTGAVRDHSAGRDVDHLSYEAYKPMAIKVMDDIAAEIEGEIPDARIAIEHRVGTLAIGDCAVVIACGAPHRAEAFKGCRLMIDRLKDRVPIWKKEVGPDGVEWVGLGP